eukprot:GHUV01023213.1.p1 GENE.GHUV01023213.1~~GHUV01023213.1.p1  ORF type:complete len:286 (+),score=77.25 GHUV01023213.1:187-1044(+)
MQTSCSYGLPLQHAVCTCSCVSAQATPKDISRLSPCEPVGDTAPCWQPAAPWTPCVSNSPPFQVVMTATARAGFSDDDSTPYMTYHTFGVAAAEVEVDCCTGERQLLRADMMFDAGRSVNPAIDLGQVEGAFMMGVGHILHEEVVEDEVTGRTVSNTTWEYKPPGIHELPAELNVYMLKDSPMHMPTRKQLSAKATGEPPMLMSAAVACALQDAITAAWADHQARQQPQQQHLQQPSGAGGCDGANGVRYNGSNGGGMQGSVPHPALELPAATVNIKRALPPLIA